MKWHIGIQPGTNIHLNLKAVNFLYINYSLHQRVFKFKNIINVLDSSFRFIWIPMLWVYDRYKYFYSYSAGIYFRR